MDLVSDYLALMRIRMGERLSYAFDLPAALGEVAVPPMLLQPLVENAIAHGLEPKIEGGHLAVSAQLSGGMLALTVHDNGRGLDAGPGKAGTSVGLANTRERLQAIYGERATLELTPAAPQVLIAEDEPILAATLAHALKRLWPEAELVASCPHGADALEKALVALPIPAKLARAIDGLRVVTLTKASKAGDWPAVWEPLMVLLRQNGEELALPCWQNSTACTTNSTPGNPAC
eukprot:gene25666-28998_t